MKQVDQYLFKDIPPDVIKEALLTYLKDHPEVLTEVLNSYPLTCHLATKEDLKMIISLIEKRFEDINKRFEDMNRRFEDINKRFEDMNKRFEDMNRRFEDMNQKFSLLVKLFLSFNIPLLFLVTSLVIKIFFTH